MISTKDETTSDSASIVMAKASAASISDMASPRSRILNTIMGCLAYQDSSIGLDRKAGSGKLPFHRSTTLPHIGAWRKIPTLRKNPQSPEIQGQFRRRGPRCSRSGRRWRNCSIPRSIAARAALAPAPGCSRRRTIPGTAAPAARPPRIARGPRRAARAKTSRSAMRCGSPQTPGLRRIPAARIRAAPITAPPPPFPRSIRNWQSSSASPPRRKTPRRWRGRRATRWRRSASPPPPTRWTR